MDVIELAGKENLMQQINKLGWNSNLCLLGERDLIRLMDVPSKSKRLIRRGDFRYQY
jgi:hypothetical protein